MSSSLKTIVHSHVEDPNVSGLIAETEYQPLGGTTTPVSPPTYARENNDPSQAPHHAYTDAAFVPAATESGWYTGTQRTEDANRSPRQAPRVVLDSYASQSGRAESALWHAQDRMGVTLPGIVLDGRKAAESENDQSTKEALAQTVSSWEAAHRHTDGWFRFGSADGTTQVWQQDVGTSESPEAANLKTLITAAGPHRGELLYRHFPNSSVFGFWLSSGVAARHKLPRAYSSEIVGYGALPVVAGATKLDPTGGASNTSRVLVGKGDRALSTATASTKGAFKPSKIGLGQVPNHPVARGYVCELILQQTTISLSVLRSLTYPTRDQELAATTVLTLLGIAGRYLSAENGFLRSGCALVPVTDRWGWRRRGSAEPEPLEITDFQQIAEALREAVAEAAALGLPFAEPIELTFSAAEEQLIRERVSEESQKITSTEG